MVEKHMERQRAAAEAEKVALMAMAYPSASPELVAAALAAVGWDLEAARDNLKAFLKAEAEAEKCLSPPRRAPLREAACMQRPAGGEGGKGEGGLGGDDERETKTVDGSR